MYKALIIGGSAGSFQVITKILSSLPNNLAIPVLLCLHRLKHIRSGFVEALSIKSNIPVVEPNDKDTIKPGIAYLAPANYHMYIELNKKIALSTEDVVNHSRPSIDLSFMTAAYAYRNKLVGIILSGANKDGAFGLKKISEQNGLTIVQDPNESQVRTMPEASMKLTKVNHIFTINEIIKFVQNLN